MKVKFFSLITLVSLAAVILAGCSGSKSTASASSGLSTVTRLAVGTLKLEGTAQAVTTAQAAQLQL